MSTPIDRVSSSNSSSLPTCAHPRRHTESASQEPVNVGASHVSDDWLRLPDWRVRARVVFARKLQGVVQAEKSGRLFDGQKHELAVDIKNMEIIAYNAR